jgi:5-methylcytosine-specific restriction endonuclease McrA
MEDGTHVSAETSARLACDASRTVMRHDEAGRIVEVAARNRTIPPALRRALQARDQGCRFPGCGSRVTEGHHIQHWARGGPTTLSNLALLCRRHHRAVHEEGFEIAPGPDEALHFRRPGGELLPEAADGDSARAARRGRPLHHPAYRLSPLAGRTTGPCVGDRCAAAADLAGRAGGRAGATAEGRRRG